MTWAPLDGSTGNDVISTLDIDPKELNKERNLTWTGKVAEGKGKSASEGDDSRQSSSVELEKPAKKRARKNGKEGIRKTQEEID